MINIRRASLRALKTVSSRVCVLFYSLFISQVYTNIYTRRIHRCLTSRVEPFISSHFILSSSSRYSVSIFSCKHFFMERLSAIRETSSSLSSEVLFFHEKLHSRVKPAKNNVSSWNIYLPRTQRCGYIGLSKNTLRRRWRNNILPFCWVPDKRSAIILLHAISTNYLVRELCYFSCFCSSKSLDNKNIYTVNIISRP